MALGQKELLPSVCLLHPTARPSCISAPPRAAVCLSDTRVLAAICPDVFKRSAILINRSLFQEPTSNTLVIFHDEAGTTG